MTTKLDAINTMLECVGQSPLQTLQGTKSYYTVTAIHILEKECQRVLLVGWDFNTDERFELKPDTNKHINISPDMLQVQLPELFRNRYVQRYNKLYDKIDHTFEIKENIPCRIIRSFDFDDIPENFKHYVAISSAYKFCKRVLGSESACTYTREDVQQAYNDLLGYELETGNYSLIPEMRNGTVRGDI